METDIQNTLTSHNGQLVLGAIADEHTLVAAITQGQLMLLTLDPRESENPKLRAKSAELAALYEKRREVQRLFGSKSSAKASNVQPYSEYLESTLLDGEDGAVPEVILWTATPLRVQRFPQAPLGQVAVPYSLRLIAIDGETQLAARYVALERRPEMADTIVTIKICHGRSAEWARNAFYDLNVRGVTPNAGVALAMNTKDPAMRIVRVLEKQIPLFTGRINTASRQVGKNSSDLVTITAMRNGVLTLAEGIKGVQRGAQPLDLQPLQVANVQKVAIEWFSLLSQIYSKELEDKQHGIMATGAVLAALGAMGHDLLSFANDEEGRLIKREELVNKLRGVIWERGPAWFNIAGKVGKKGDITVGGPKEVGYTIYKALIDPASPEGRQVRGASAMAAE
ncbi:DNA sulfur modification protein DndB [Chondromyces crocatus]|uniref:DGQHR domain-containing protein n=1 Tax=Chondromyces crocatus TaxID=52 RepID=A0A0K1E6Y1_CHOCO|nr:DNA sulfur modification protein DndB [Chondromyces crocatus]AKT36457.1 uncharacterized protein CMC5_005720 [Chondromyces crocatus]